MTATIERPRRRRRAGRNAVREGVGKGVVYLGLIALSAFIILPLGWMLTVALLPDNTSIFTSPPRWFPTEFWHWENFERALFNPQRPFALYLFNTVFLEVFVVFGSVVSCALVAYPLASAWGADRLSLPWADAASGAASLVMAMVEMARLGVRPRPGDLVVLATALAGLAALLAVLLR